MSTFEAGGEWRKWAYDHEEKEIDDMEFAILELRKAMARVSGHRARLCNRVKMRYRKACERAARAEAACEFLQEEDIHA